VPVFFLRSTLARLLGDATGLHLIADRDIKRPRRPALDHRRRMPLLMLFNDLIRYNIAYGKPARHRGRANRQTARIHDFHRSRRRRAVMVGGAALEAEIGA
jgi:ABC-type transport system involved in Fe-S cluster assembly fused permease/ATPase subunit